MSKIFVIPDGRIRKERAFPDTYSTTDPIHFTRADNPLIEVQFLDEFGSPRRKDSGALIQVSLKKKGEYDGDLIAFASTTTRPDDDLSTYKLNLDLTGDVISDLLQDDGNVSNDEASVDVMFEVSVSESGGGASATDWVRTRTIYARIHNNVYRSGDAAPSSNPRYAEYVFAGIDLDTTTTHFRKLKEGFIFRAIGGTLIFDDTAASGTAPAVAYGASDDGSDPTLEFSDNFTPDGAQQFETESFAQRSVDIDTYSYLYLALSGAPVMAGQTVTFRIFGWEEPAS
mgnify:CR=1 FL=1